MEENKVVELFGREAGRDALSLLLREGAVKLLQEAVEAEVEEFLALHRGKRLADGRLRVVRNGHLPEREVQTGIGNVAVSVPRTRDRGQAPHEEELRFKSALLPRYLRKSASIEELIPWLYLKGISTNDFQEALQSILGKGAGGLSSSTISRLKQGWEAECQTWQKRCLKDTRYVYFWVDGIHCKIRQEDEKLCILVIIGVTETGQKELVALADGYRESEESWLTVLRDLKERGLLSPQLAIGDGALGFWNALWQVFPGARKQQCWQHKTINVLDKLPKMLQKRALSLVQQIWMAETKEDALVAWHKFENSFQAKYPKAVDALTKDQDSLLTFYDFPADHWLSIRTTNPIESTFASVRHRSSRAKGCVSRNSMHALVFKLVSSAQTRWRKLKGFRKLAQVVQGVKFKDGLRDRNVIPDHASQAEKVAA
jgi:transposase-like protein